jgi:hypothetical protein
MIVAVVLLLVVVIAAVQQRCIWLLHRQIGRLAECLGILNDALKALAMAGKSQIVEPDPLNLDRINSLVFAEVARHLEAEDDDIDEADDDELPPRRH